MRYNKPSTTNSVVPGMTPSVAPGSPASKATSLVQKVSENKVSGFLDRILGRNNSEIEKIKKETQSAYIKMQSEYGLKVIEGSLLHYTILYLSSLYGGLNLLKSDGHVELANKLQSALDRFKELLAEDIQRADDLKTIDEELSASLIQEAKDTFLKRIKETRELEYLTKHNPALEAGLQKLNEIISR